MARRARAGGWTGTGRGGGSAGDHRLFGERHDAEYGGERAPPRLGHPRRRAHVAGGTEAGRRELEHDRSRLRVAQEKIDGVVGLVMGVVGTREVVVPARRPDVLSGGSGRGSGRPATTRVSIHSTNLIRMEGHASKLLVSGVQ